MQGVPSTETWQRTHSSQIGGKKTANVHANVASPGPWFFTGFTVYCLCFAVQMGGNLGSPLLVLSIQVASLCVLLLLYESAQAEVQASEDESGMVLGTSHKQSYSQALAP